MATGSGGAYHNGGNGGASAAVPYARSTPVPASISASSIYRTASGDVIPTTFVPGEGKPDGQMLSHSDPSHFLVDSNGNKI